MIIQSIILGILQGFTEFLPVSSSGHLVLAQRIFNFSIEGIFFESLLHLGTTLAVVVYFRKKIFSLSIEDIKLYIIASIPIAIIGLLFKDLIESMFDSTKLVGIALLVTAGINFLIDRQDGRKEKLDTIDAIVIGIAQCIAIIPGISRSGSTILAARSSHIQAAKAAEFSFLMSIPAIFGANVLQFITHPISISNDAGIYISGFLAAFVAGYVAIFMVMRFLEEKRFKAFGAYLVVISLATLFFL